MRSVGEWLDSHGLGQYAAAFEQNDVELEFLSELTEQDLEKLGVASLGHRKKLLRAIDGLPAVEELRVPDLEADVRRPKAEAERRQLTVVFIDLVDSTGLSTRLDPEDLREVILQYQNAVAGEVTRFEGHVAKFMGDGVLAYFGWPRAHEDEADRAVRAALSIVGRVAGLTTPEGEPPSVRIGIATGLVVVGDLVGEGAAQEEAVVGETPNLAARLQSVAMPGQIVVSETTRQLLGDLFELEDLGTRELKGMKKPVPTFAVQRERSTESRFDARQMGAPLAMVGRDQEIALILERWRQAKAGEGQTVLLTGQAGIGKSRIVRALIDAVAEDDHIRINYQSSPYHTDSALYPAIRQLHRAAGLMTEDDLGAQLDRLEALLARAVDNVGEAAPLIATLLGLNGESRYGKSDLAPQQQRARTLQSLAAQLTGLARKKPVLFIVEDMHWIDPTTLELIELILDQIVGAPVLLIMTARPNFEHGLGGHPTVTRLALNRLGRTGVEAIVSQLRGGKELTLEVMDAISERADGIPLYAEELTKAILETGETSIPATLHDSLVARLDRIPEVKEVAQIAACIGREFDSRLLAAVARTSDDEVQTALIRLLEAELVFRRGTGPAATYIFKHALVRDAAYESLLRDKRRMLHERLVDVLQGANPGVDPEILGHHATEAGLTEQAIGYWQKAGEAALAKPAYREAVGHLSQAIRLTGEMGEGRAWRERELHLQIQLGQALMASDGYAAEPNLRAFQRAMALANDLGETPLLMPALFGEWAARYIRGEPTPDLVARFARLADAAGDTGLRLVSLRMLALERFHTGHFSEARDLVDEALALYDPAEHRELALQFGHDPRSAALNYRAWTLWHLGYPDQARRAGAEGIAWAKELGHANTIGIAQCWGGLLTGALQRDADCVERQARDLIPFVQEAAMSLWEAWSRVFLGWALVRQGQHREGLDEISAGLSQTRRTGAGRILPLLLGLAAEAQLMAGDLTKASTTIEDAFGSLKRTGDVAWAADLHRIRAALLLDSSAPQLQDAEADFLRAIEIAKKQQAPSLELRAATGLAQLWAEQGEREKGVDLLAPIYGRFTEGFETADLTEARVLLKQLA